MEALECSIVAHFIVSEVVKKVCLSSSTVLCVHGPFDVLFSDSVEVSWLSCAWFCCCWMWCADIINPLCCIKSAELTLYFCFDISWQVCLYIMLLTVHIQGDHLSGNIREFDSCQGNVSDFTKNQGNVGGENPVREKLPKTIHARI